MTEPPVVYSVVDLLGLVELTGLKTYEIRGRLVDPQVDTAGAPERPMDVMVRYEGTTIEARLRLEQRTDDAVLLADIAVLYTMSEPHEIPDDVLGEFLERVGVMAVFPFVREAVATSASRLGVPVPVIGLLRAGEIRVKLPDDVDAAGGGVGV